MPIDGDESSKPLGPNSVGELCFKGDLIMKGYCNDDSATATTIDKYGWLHSGDVGYYDEQGYFYIVDRLKELIKYKAFQVPPAELEALLLSCPGIKDAAVIGLPDEEAGELPTAFVVKQDGYDITADDITKFVNGMCPASQKFISRSSTNNCYCRTSIESQTTPRRNQVRREHPQNGIRKDSAPRITRCA